jgi:hypothetical protein
MPNKSMIGKSTKYKCGGKVHKKNKGGAMKMSKCCAAAYLHEAANVQKGRKK